MEGVFMKRDMEEGLVHPSLFRSSEPTGGPITASIFVRWGCPRLEGRTESSRYCQNLASRNLLREPALIDFGMPIDRAVPNPAHPLDAYLHGERLRRNRKRNTVFYPV
jgi:hypothetical protein